MPPPHTGSWPDPDIRGRIEAIAAHLVRHGQTLVTIECTLGGWIGHLCTNVAGASAWYLGGVTPYSAAAKLALLGLNAEGFAPHGAVSAQAAAVMARAGRDRLGGDWTLAETGLTGPRAARRSAKTPGIVFLHLLGPNGLEQARSLSTGLDDRLANKQAFLDAALDLLSESISRNVEIPVV